ncbi:MAG TPA: efflux RND transporter periplasmic adaptor subunit [Thermoanaerobaculia bacterium]|nr:efflux RND transporter periplasmic adaptor subunit [Thermoanaerobaculia bacterium]
MKRPSLPSVLAPILLLAGLSGLTILAGCARSKPPATQAAAAPAGTESAPPLPSDVGAVSGIAKADPPAPAEKTDPPAASPPPTPDDSRRVAATGEFVSPVRSELAMRLPGRVGKVLVDEGARVRRGQPLLELETEYLKLDLERTDADLARAHAATQDAERDLSRKKELIAKNSVSQAAYDRSSSASDSARAAEQSALAARDLARQRLADAVLRSPIDGVVAERRTDVGQRLADNSVAFVVAQTAPLKLRFKLPERYLAAVRRGQAVTAAVDPYPQETFRGRVTLVGGVVDPATRSFNVETEFDNRDGRLYPGLFARVEIEVAPGQSTAKGGSR